MTDKIKDAIPKVLKTLWDIENELRGAAQDGVMMRRDEARKHLAEARAHLDELLGMARAEDSNTPVRSSEQPDASPSKSIDSQL